MGLQKYRSDRAGDVCANGAVPYYADWLCGPSLALVRNCPVSNVAGVTTRTVYVQGEPDTYFSQPAKALIFGHPMRGSLCRDENGDPVFHVYYDI